jgi:SPP1 gp7 family putative phage head morphogenesis protein
MNEVITYQQVKNYDPTHTTSLRNAFSRNMNRRFAELASVVRKAITVDDCFGLKIKTHTLQMSTPGKEAFNFSRSSDKVEAFMTWLQKQVDAGIIDFQQVGSSVESAWTNMYISDSYKRGVIRARYEMMRAGMNIPSIDDSGGIGVSMMNPFHVDRVGLLFTRVFSDLRGITSAMDSQISRVLAQGMADGDGAVLLARKLVAIINGTGMGELGITDTLGRFIPAGKRAMLLARTEIIRAHHLATIQEYRNWGVEGITVLGEWKTAGDDRVCEKCASLEGQIFTLDEIEPMIPLHPLCRCISLPYIEELQKYYTKN